MKPNLSSLLICLCLFVRMAAAQDVPKAEPYPRVSEEAFKARLPFFDYPKDVALEGRVVQEWDKETLMQKIVFRGAQGFLVPGFLEFPKGGAAPHPLVLLLHGWSGNKQGWYEDGNIMSGGEMRKALLKAGYAILALDAATHGERSNEIDYQHVNPHEDPMAPARRNYYSYAEITVQTIKDYRRALDYLEERGDVDMTRIGLVGYSMGGMDSFVLLSVEPRVKMAVACVPLLLSEGYGPASPIDYSWGIKGQPFLMLMGRQDDMYDAGKVEASFKSYLEGPDHKMMWFDKGHNLTAVYVPEALAWVKAHL